VLSHHHPPDLRNSASAEADTAATLDGELASLQAALAEQQAGHNGGGGATAELASLACASAAARDSAAELADACAAQRMELARLQEEARHAEQFVHGQVRHGGAAQRNLRACSLMRA
jgi:hypothetical protein